MTWEIAKEFGIAGAVLFLFINQAFALVERFRRAASERASKADEHITSQHSQADSLIAELLRKATEAWREDTRKLSTKVDHLYGKLEELSIQNTKLQAELHWAARKDVDFHDRMLPALLKRAEARDFRIDANRASIDEVRAHLGMPLTSQTPAYGSRIPEPIDDDSGHTISPLDAAKKKKD